MFYKVLIFVTILSVTYSRSATPSKFNIVVEGSSSISSSSSSSSHKNDDESASSLPENIVPRAISGSGGGINRYMNDIKYLYRTYQDCTKSDVTSCLKMKLITTMDKAFNNIKDVSVIDGIKFIDDGDVSPQEFIVKSEAEFEASLPRSLDDKNSVLNSLILKKIVGFFKSHTLQIKFPNPEERSLSDDGTDGRGKKDKGSYVMIPLLLGGTFIPIAYGALALLAGKALIVSKLALVLASIIGIKKLVSGSGGHHESSHEVVVGHGHSGWGRNYDVHNLPYNAYGIKN